MKKSNLTGLSFGGHPVFAFKLPHSEELYIFCKGVVGTLNQLEEFIRTNEKKPFGAAEIQHTEHKTIKVDCLEDSYPNLMTAVAELRKLEKMSHTEIFLQMCGADKSRKQAQIISNSVRKNNIAHKINTIQYTVVGFYAEIAYALYLEMIARYTVLDLEEESDVSGKSPPRMKTLELPTGENIKFPESDFMLPGMTSQEKVSLSYHSGRYTMYINFTIAKSSEALATELVTAVIKRLKTSSIYKNRCIHFELNPATLSYEPRFFGSNQSFNTPIWIPEYLKLDIQTIVNRISLNAEEAKEKNMHRKANYLFSSDTGGTGKTHTIFNYLLPIALQNGWTAVVCNDSSRAQSSIDMASIFLKRGYSVILVIEDIDLVSSGENRTAEINNLLTAFDSPDQKSLPLIILATTNNSENMLSYLIRRFNGGELKFKNKLDFEEVESMIGFCYPELDIEEAYIHLVGYTQAFIVSIIEKAKISNEELTADLIIRIADSFKEQFSLTRKQIKREEPKKENEVDKLKDAINVFKSIIFNGESPSEFPKNDYKIDPPANIGELLTLVEV